MAYKNNLPDCSQTGDQFCAGALQFDVCKGDSGSPAFWFEECTPTLVGIVAEVQSTNNNGCGNQFDIYETIDFEWVAEILRDGKHCM